MRTFMLAFSVGWLWIGSGILAYGFTNGYNQFLHCNAVEWKQRPRDTGDIAGDLVFGPFALIVEVARTNLAMYGFNYDPGCPVKE